jgi:fatty acid desaturase
MSDNTLRHLIAFLITFMTLFAYVSGYVSGQYGWWWTGVGVIVIYGAVRRIIK